MNSSVISLLKKLIDFKTTQGKRIQFEFSYGQQITLQIMKELLSDEKYSEVIIAMTMTQETESNQG